MPGVFSDLLFGTIGQFFSVSLSGKRSHDIIRSMARLLILLALCLSQVDINRAVCKALCRQDGYDSGDFSKNKCLCINEIEFEVATEKATIIRPTGKPGSTYYQAPAPQTNSGSF